MPIYSTRPKQPTLPLLTQQAKSMCTCAHVGDGLHAEHGGLFGHGPCAALLPDGLPCPCPQFTWARFLTPDEQLEYIREGILNSKRF
jgi:hypothetical protein